MLYSNDRDEYRKIFFDAWAKHKKQEPLQPLEAQLVDIMMHHPEYHAILDDPENNRTQNFESGNPFLHMSLHLGIREQVATNRPAGIREVYLNLCKKSDDVQVAEHRMMEYLAKVLWEAQQSGKMLDEATYLEGLQKL